MRTGAGLSDFGTGVVGKPVDVAVEGERGLRDRQIPRPLLRSGIALRRAALPVRPTSIRSEHKAL